MVGNLVRIKRASIGVPAGALGLIIEDHSMERGDEFPEAFAGPRIEYSYN